MQIVINILLVIHVMVSLLIILLTLMQRPKNEGLGAAFGGGMTENLFGAQTTNVLQTMTRYLGGVFFALTLLLSWLYVKQTSGKSTLQQRLMAPATIPKLATPAPVPAATPAPESKTLATATPEPSSKPAQATPAPAEKPATENKPAATPAPEAAKPAATPVPEPAKPAATPKPEATTPATPAPAIPAPAATPAPATPAPATEQKPATPAPATPVPAEKPGN